MKLLTNINFYLQLFLILVFTNINVSGEFRSNVEYDCLIQNPPTLTGGCGSKTMFVRPKYPENFKLDITVMNGRDMTNDTFSINVGGCDTGIFKISKQLLRQDNTIFGPLNVYLHYIENTLFNIPRVYQQTFTLEFNQTYFMRTLSTINRTDIVECEREIRAEKDGMIPIDLMYSGSKGNNIRIFVLDSEPPLPEPVEKKNLFTDQTFHPEFIFFVFFGIIVGIIAILAFFIILEVQKGKHRRPKIIKLVLLTREMVDLGNKIKNNPYMAKNRSYHCRLDEKQLESNILKYQLGLIKERPERQKRQKTSKNRSKTKLEITTPAGSKKQTPNRPSSLKSDTLSSSPENPPPLPPPSAKSTTNNNEKTYRIRGYSPFIADE